jgi:catechol 2,3-dioxygenase-like lactoylglutathione lyase family enzyme
MKVSHVHCRVRDLPAAARWFQQVLQATAVFNNERMAWLGFGEFGVILDAAPADSALTVGFDSENCDEDYRTLASRGAETIEAPQDRPWGARSAYLKGPGRDRTGTETDLKHTPIARFPCSLGQALRPARLLTLFCMGRMGWGRPSHA